MNQRVDCIDELSLDYRISKGLQTDQSWMSHVQEHVRANGKQEVSIRPLGQNAQNHRLDKGKIERVGSTMPPKHDSVS